MWMIFNFHYADQTRQGTDRTLSGGGGLSEIDAHSGRAQGEETETAAESVAFPQTFLSNWDVCTSQQGKKGKTLL